MTTALQSTCFQKCTACLNEWTAKNPQMAKITAIACLVLGIAFTAAVAGTIVLPAVAIAFSVAAAATLSLSIMLFISYAKHSSAKSPLPPQQIEISHTYLIKVMQETLENLKKHKYISADGNEHALNMQFAIAGTQFIKSTYGEGRRPGNLQTRIHVVSQDCLYAAQSLYEKGLNPIVLDLANAFHPGGGYLGGADAQEEDLCRRSGLSVAIDNRHGMQMRNFFPLNPEATPAAGLYVPAVPVFRAGRDKQYQYLDQPFAVAFAVLAAPCRPPLERINGRLRLNDKNAHEVRERIRTMLDMAYVNNHRSIVLGAFGCGAFGNPPEHVAEIFNDVIQAEYPGCFEEIVFAILDDHNAGKEHNPEGNFTPFNRQFPV